MLLRITNLKALGPTFSSLESKMAPSNEGEHGGKRDNSGRKSTKMMKIEGNHLTISAKEFIW